MKNTQRGLALSSSKGFTAIEVVIVLAIVALLGGVYYVTQNNKKTDTPVTTTTTTPTTTTTTPAVTTTPTTTTTTTTTTPDPTADWKTYTNTKNGYSFKYPGDYTLQDINDPAIEVYSPDRMKEIDKLNKTATGDRGGVPPSLAIYPVSKSVSEYTKDSAYSNKGQTTIDGITFKQGVYDGLGKQMMFIGDVRGQTYIIYAMEEDYNKNLDLYKNILSTFKFTK